MLNYKGLIRVLQGAYKVVPIPYLTLLNSTLPNYTGPDEVFEAPFVEEIQDTEDKKIQNTKYNKDEWDDYLSNEGFGTLIAKSLIEIGWKPKENTASFQKWVDKTLDANKITRSEKDYDKLKSGLIGFVEHFKVNKSKVPKASLSSNFCLRFNLK